MILGLLSLLLTIRVTNHYRLLSDCYHNHVFFFLFFLCQPSCYLFRVLNITVKNNVVCFTFFIGKNDPANLYFCVYNNNIWNTIYPLCSLLLIVFLYFIILNFNKRYIFKKIILTWISKYFGDQYT